MIQTSRSRSVVCGRLHQTDRRKSSKFVVKIHFGVQVNCNNCISFFKRWFSCHWHRYSRVSRSDRTGVDILRVFLATTALAINPVKHQAVVFNLSVLRQETSIHSVCDFMLLFTLIKLSEPLPSIWLIDQRQFPFLKRRLWLHLTFKPSHVLCCWANLIFRLWFTPVYSNNHKFFYKHNTVLKAINGRRNIKFPLGRTAVVANRFPRVGLVNSFPSALTIFTVSVFSLRAPWCLPRWKRSKGWKEGKL